MALNAITFEGQPHDPVLTLSDELGSSTAASYYRVTASELGIGQFDAQNVWSLLLRAVSEITSVEINSETVVGTNSIFSATTHWKTIAPHGTVDSSFVISQIFFVKLEVIKLKTCEVSVETLVKLRKRESGRETLFRGDTSHFGLHVSEFRKLDLDDLDHDIRARNSENALSTQILSAIKTNLSSLKVGNPEYETK
jgi:hypothetical protein